MKTRQLFTWISMIGIVRFVGVWSVPVGLLAPAFGLVYLALKPRISKILIPSYLICVLGILGGLYNGIPAKNFAQFAVVIGGLGMAEFLRRVPTRTIVDFIATRLIWIVLALTAFELVLVMMGMGQRIRELSGDFGGGILPDIGITVPRLMGSLGGSGYSAAMSGTLALICFVNRRHLPAALYLLVAILMVSRGPFVGLIAAFGFLMLRRFPSARSLSYVFPILCFASPVLVWFLEQILSAEQILYLIAVSTRRFLHYMSFLDFGLENPVFGIGYSQYYEYYAEYFWGADFQQWGFTNFTLIREAHNFMLDIFGELGAIAWVLAGLQLILIHRMSLKGDGCYAAVMINIAVCFLFLSGLSNWIYWFAVGFILSHADEVRAAEHPDRQGEPSAPYRTSELSRYNTA